MEVGEAPGAPGAPGTRERPGRGGGRRRSFPTPTELADRLGISAATLVIGALCIVAAGIGGWWALRSPDCPDVETVLPMADTLVLPDTAAPPAAKQAIIVDVVGAVTHAGVHELPAGSRVADAVAASGGLTPEADRVRLNMAEPLVDGARLWVPSVGDDIEPPVVTVERPSDGLDQSSGAPTRQVNINTADVATLESLPGIGPALARAIIDHRNRNGVFRSIDGLIDVSGIGPAKYHEIRPHITVHTP